MCVCWLNGDDDGLARFVGKDWRATEREREREFIQKGSSEAQVLRMGNYGVCFI